MTAARRSWSCEIPSSLLQPYGASLVSRCTSTMIPPAFQGLSFGQLGDYGALVHTENLVLTQDILHEAYKSGSAILTPPEEPPYLHLTRVNVALAANGATGSTNAEEYPAAFLALLPATQATNPTRPGLTLTPAGYGFASGDAMYSRGYFAATERRRYDFHDDPEGKGRGLRKVAHDPLGRDTSIVYDAYDLLPTTVTDPAGLTTSARYNYRVLQPQEVTDPNGNRTRFTFTPLGLLEDTWVLGKTPGEGDQSRPSVRMEYNFLAFANSPPT